MRHPFLLLLLALLAAACGQDSNALETSSGDPETAGARTLTEIQWIDSARNFGKIAEGQKLVVSFRFRNAGNKPLIIESVTPSCGCTVADYPKKPIAPGQEGEITGEFDSNGREGHQHKELTVKSNTAKPLHTIHFEVNVVKKPGTETGANNVF